ncbi:MAG: hypothetical protein QOE28_2418 [Solirubrobacteraceae bacterium]|jgi:hypothetical protein|nr:hypothetical protein [Solirubrobacteraceae bacterium]
MLADRTYTSQPKTTAPGGRFEVVRVQPSGRMAINLDARGAS